MDIFRMKCFISVVENQSLSKAAREIFITQPAMTAQMNSLEDELDTKLINRGQKQTRITPMGEVVLNTFRVILSDLEDMHEKVKSIESEAYGKIRVGFHGPAEWAHVDKLMRAFHRQYPEIEVEIIIDTWNHLREIVDSRELDASFMELSEIEGMHSIASQELFVEQLCVVVPHDHRLATNNEVDLGEIRGEKLYLPEYAISPRFLHYFDRQMTNAGFLIKKTGQGNYSEATITLAASGFGITIMPRSFKRKSSSVKYIDLENAGIVLNMGLIWHRKAINPALSEFVSFCANWNWI